MTQPTVDILLPGHLDAVGESPVWSMAEQALYWVDIEAPALRRWSMADATSSRAWAAPERIACVALHANGGLIAGMETAFRVRPGAAGLLDCTLPAMVHHPEPGMRFNDGRCDRQVDSGRAPWCATCRWPGLRAACTAPTQTGSRPVQVQGLVTQNGLGLQAPTVAPCI